MGFVTRKKKLLHANSARNSAVVISPLLVALLKDIKTKFATCSMSSFSQSVAEQADLRLTFNYIACGCNSS